MASRKLSDLTPLMQSKAARFKRDCAAAGVDVLIYCTLRTEQEQDALYMQGRNALAVVNASFKSVGLAPISEKQNCRPCTWARGGQSAHQYGKAFDCVPLQAGKPVWDSSSILWQIIGSIGLKCGLSWGGTWSAGKREYPHFEDVDFKE